MSDPIDPATLRGGPLAATVEHHPSLGSTNDLARELLTEGAPLPALVVADRQTAGRGRGANRWWAADGALTFSLALDAKAHGLPAERVGLVAIATALAVIDAVHSTTGLAAGLKWPNDVLLGGKKLAGVLIESPRPGRLVVGVGVNVRNRLNDAPAEVQARATSLIEHADTTRQAVLAAFLQGFDRRLTQIARGDTACLDGARHACVLTGSEVRVTDGDRVVEGVCRGIANDGALVVNAGGADVAVYAGSVERR